MTSYGQFATIYEPLMTSIPYDQYVERVERTVGSLRGKAILDLGCGTGILARKFEAKGANVTGLDLSSSMIEYATQKGPQTIDYVVAPMQQFELDRSFDLVVCAIDALNYVIDWDDVIATFRHVYRHLNEGGHFIFDIQSLEKMAILYEESPFTYDDGHIAYIWETEEGDDEHSVVSHLTFFVQREDGAFERFDETHVQRTHAYEYYANALIEIGFTVEMITADWTLSPPTEESERIFFQLKK